MSKDSQDDRVEQLGFSKTLGAALVVTWACLLAAAVTLRRQTDYSGWKQLHWFESFYRTGSIVFSGGQVSLPSHVAQPCRCSVEINYHCRLPASLSWPIHQQLQLCRYYVQPGAQPQDSVPQVVFPLLENELVATGWISLQDYLTAIALVQALPGPLFNISAYLGERPAY